MQNLKIGFDAKRVFQNFTGLGNYSRTLLESFANFCPEIELHLYAPKKNEQPRTKAFLTNPYYAHFPNSSFSQYWRTKGIVNDLIKDGIQIYHGLSHEIPVGIEKTKIKTVVTIHDLIFKKYPKQYKPWDRWIYEKKFKSACERADVVVAISASTKKDIIKFYNIPEHKIKVIYQSVHDQFFQPLSKASLASVQQRLRLPEHYFLYVGSVIPRKNLKLIVEAYALLAHHDIPPLMIVGHGGDYRSEVEALIQKTNLSDRIRFLDEANFADFPALYASADLLCYPSIYEGFGLPLVEALSQKTAVLTYQGSSLPEAAGPGAHYLKSLNAKAIAEALSALASDAQYRKDLGQAGYEYIQQFRAEALAQQWQALYQQLV